MSALKALRGKDSKAPASSSSSDAGLSNQNVKISDLLVSTPSIPDWLYCSDYSFIDGSRYSPMEQEILATNQHFYPFSEVDLTNALQQHLQRRDLEVTNLRKPWVKSCFITLHEDREDLNTQVANLRVSDDQEKTHDGRGIAAGKLIEGEQRTDASVFRINGKSLGKLGVKVFHLQTLFDQGVLQDEYSGQHKLFGLDEYWAWGPVPKEAINRSEDYATIRVRTMNELGFIEGDDAEEEPPRTSRRIASRSTARGKRPLKEQDVEMEDVLEDDVQEQEPEVAVAGPFTNSHHTRAQAVKKSKSTKESKAKSVRKPRSPGAEARYMKRNGFWAVDDILQHQWREENYDGEEMLEYRIKWKGTKKNGEAWGNSWEPDVLMTESAVDDYWKKMGKKKPTKKPASAQ